MSSRTVLRRLLSATHRGHARLYSSTSPAAATRSTSARTVGTVVGAAVLAGSGYAFGSFYPPELITYISPRPGPSTPEAHTPAALAHSAKLEAELHLLPVLNEHRHRPDTKEWYEVRPYVNVPAERRVNSLTGGALSGPGKLALPPLVRARRDEREAWIFMHLGRGLCGHEGIIHGGLLATILDETLGRIAILNTPEKVAVTANLKLNYRAPTKADQWVVIKTRVVDSNGRKVNVAGSIEAMDGTLLADATGLFIQPKYAKLMDTTALVAAMGQPDPLPIEGTPAEQLGVKSATT